MPVDRLRLWLAVVATAVFSLGTAVVYAASPGAGPAEAVSDELDGRTVFGARGCLACHQSPGLDGGQIGPDLTTVAAVAGSRVPGLEAVDYLRQSIREPRSFVVPGFSPIMPDLGLSDEEIEAVVAFLLGYTSGRPGQAPLTRTR